MYITTLLQWSLSFPGSLIERYKCRRMQARLVDHLATSALTGKTNKQATPTRTTDYSDRCISRITGPPFRLGLNGDLVLVHHFILHCLMEHIHLCA